MVTTHGSLFTCLQGSQPPEWVSGSLLLGLVSEDPYCGIQVSLGPPLAVWDGTLIPQGESKPSRGALQLSCKPCEWLL